MKVDGYTPVPWFNIRQQKNETDTKKKLEFIINKGTKSQFLRTEICF